MSKHHFEVNVSSHISNKEKIHLLSVHRFQNIDGLCICVLISALIRVTEIHCDWNQFEYLNLRMVAHKDESQQLLKTHNKII